LGCRNIDRSPFGLFVPPRGHEIMSLAEALRNLEVAEIVFRIMYKGIWERI
jgi:hypothetical protein